MFRLNNAAMLVVILLCTNCAYSQNIEIDERLNNQKSILTAESAQIKALEFLGFSKMEGFEKKRHLEKASKLIITDDKTPFLDERINNRDIWKVSYKNIELSPYRGYPDSVDYPRTFDVYIDPDDGKLLKIESIYNGTNIDFAPEPSSEWAENRMKGSQYKFLEFVSPDSNYVSLYDILNEMGPRNFKQLKAQLVMIPGGRNTDPVAVWFVIYRGIDPYYPKSRFADLSIKEAYNYTTFVYNAKTGNTMGTTSVPSVEPSKK